MKTCCLDSNMLTNGFVEIKNHLKKRLKFILLFFLFPMLAEAQVYVPPTLPPPPMPHFDNFFWLNTMDEDEMNERWVRKHDQYDLGKQKLEELKKGVLVVRLKSGNNKLTAYERVANSPNISAKKKQQFQSKLEEVRSEVQMENERLKTSMDENYSFSEILYLYDTSIVFLKEKIQSGYFLNDDLKIDPSISLKNRPFLVAFYGSSNLATNNREKGLVVLDQDLNELVDPFPHFTGLTTTGKSMKNFFSGKDEAYFIELAVKKFNRDLVKFNEIIEDKKDN